MTKKHMKRRSASLAVREMQIKATVRYPFTPARMPAVEMTDTQ